MMRTFNRRPTFGGVHAAHGEHRSHRGLARPGARALELRPTLGEEVVPHGLHHQALTLHALLQQRVRLHVHQELEVEVTVNFGIGLLEFVLFSFYAKRLTVD